MVFYRGNVSVWEGQLSALPPHPPPSRLLSLYFLAHPQHPHLPSTLPSPPPCCTLAPRLRFPPARNLVAAPRCGSKDSPHCGKGRTLFLHLPLPPLVCCRPQSQHRGLGVCCQDPGHHLSKSVDPLQPRLGRPGCSGLCPRCWNAYLIHHVHVGQQQLQQCRGREEPASKGGCSGGGGTRNRQNSPDSHSSSPRAPTSLATCACAYHPS